MRKTFVVLALLGLAVVPVATAHVEPSPEKVPAGGVSRITLSVEGEESVPAVKLTVQMPLGVTDVVAHPARGWKRSVRGRIVSWSGGQIPHGAVGKFSFSARMPDSPGRVLVFPSIVTYQDGNVVHWIGAENSDTPAPRVTLTASRQTTNPPPPRQPPPAPGTTSTSTEGGGGSNTWIWILIAAAVLASLAAVVIVRRRRA
jgi:LPXTG-motif cell wall-anchored protein